MKCNGNICQDFQGGSQAEQMKLPYVIIHIYKIFSAIFFPWYLL